MELRKQTYTQKNADGTAVSKTCKKWYLYISAYETTQGRRVILPLFSRDDASRRAMGTIEKILACGGSLSAGLTEEVRKLPDALRQRLEKHGLLSKQISEHIGKTLAGHIADYHAHLSAKETTKGYADQMKSYVLKVFELCAFEQWTDIDKEKIAGTLADLRKDRTENGKPLAGMGQRTSNYYLKAVKHFCRWMQETGRATYNPVEFLKAVTQTEFRQKRRALTLDEQRRLLETTENGPAHHNMNGYERAMVYRLALQTGLRANEIRSLTVSSFNLNKRTVMVQTAFAKNRKAVVLYLKPETAAQLKHYLSGKMPGLKAFAFPKQPVKMLKKDLKAAGIAYDIEGEKADFHSLRHTFGSMLAASGVHPKTAQTLMRHKDINLTMSLYTHSYREAEVSAIDSLPDLTVKPSGKTFAK